MKLFNRKATEQRVASLRSMSLSGRKRENYFVHDYTTPSGSYRQRKLQTRFARSSPCNTLTSMWSLGCERKLSETRDFAQHEDEKPENEQSHSFVFEFSIRLDRSVERLR